VFVSYCRRNKRWLQRLRVHLTPFERQGILDIWGRHAHRDRRSLAR
jgi:hypothetical protein